MLQKLKEIITKAQPRKEWRRITDGNGWYITYNLADVLMAIDKCPNVKVLVNQKGRISLEDNCVYGAEIKVKGKGQIACNWDLSKDLDGQKGGTKEWLYNLLK